MLLEAADEYLPLATTDSNAGAEDLASNESKQDITTSMNGPEGGEDDLSCSDEEEGDP